ncbi:helix-turn-helix transcriptional regulator [Rhodovulum marinum]|uniref:AlpA family transcriptional regulator n=1 Tax=Rhodovulum marinum TaxID=320662 RepID=A0A4R2Q3W9_9RHOB|nr:helix-turn-helix domain-containing protein [Rhodovulum marinum]TCP41351.1 AlpA family transcriptional regulator [Rhodovulum marinum]
MSVKKLSNTALAGFTLSPHKGECLIRDAEGAALLGCSKATWWRRVADGTLPPAIKIGGMSRWKLSDVLEVIDRASEQRKT